LDEAVHPKVSDQESQLAVEEKLSASGGAGVEDSGATPLTLVAELHFAASR